jgi:hypothetical protein
MLPEGAWADVAARCGVLMGRTRGGWVAVWRRVGHAVLRSDGLWYRGRPALPEGGWEAWRCGGGRKGVVAVGANGRDGHGVAADIVAPGCMWMRLFREVCQTLGSAMLQGTSRQGHADPLS